MRRYRIQDEVVKFQFHSNSCLDSLRETKGDAICKSSYLCDIYDNKKCHQYTSGVINALWQEWNTFWRNYWSLFIYGGDYKSVKISPINTYISGLNITNNFEKNYYNFLNPVFPRKYANNSGVVPFYSEPTWGDIKTIEKLIVYYGRAYARAGHTNISNILIQASSCINLAIDSIRHLQDTRNTSIHISSSGMHALRTAIATRYSFGSLLKYPSDVVYANCLNSRKRAIELWVEDLNAALSMF